jgi:hypothetical protein
MVSRCSYVTPTHRHRACSEGGPEGRFFHDQVSRPSDGQNGGAKWGASTKDAKVVLRIAFAQALLWPELTAHYAHYTIKLPEFTVTFFSFRIGYASFLLMITSDTDEFVVLDFDLADDESAYADQRPDALPMP